MDTIRRPTRTKPMEYYTTETAMWDKASDEALENFERQLEQPNDRDDTNDKSDQ